MTVEIIEIIGRSEQGITKPFICRADDGKIYFVKGKGAGRRSQVFEWIAGNLALKVGLPIAPFKLVFISDELIEGNPSLNELGYGIAFGSCKQSIMELNFAGISQIPKMVQQDILVFDWWIRNQDRTLTESGGNPNLFWDPKNEDIVVIDHNQAFDPDFSIHDFRLLHAFHGQINQVFDYKIHRLKYIEKYRKALSGWTDICNTLPKEWYYIDPEKTVPADFDLETIFELLTRCNVDSFWDLE